MKRTKWNPRKVLIASAGVASVNYALAAGCGGESLVANLVVCPPSQCPPTAGSGGNGGFPTVANLVAPPPAVGGASVANLVAPPPGGTRNQPNPPDPVPPADVPDASADAAADAAVDGGQ